MVAGEELVLPADATAVAVVRKADGASWPGVAKDRSLWMAPDFDAPLEDFAEYME